MTLFKKGLDLEHHGVYDISEVCVIFNILCEYVAWIYDSRVVFDVHIF